MATFIKCDGDCGRESPDPKTGLHIANQWLRVRAAKNTEFPKHEHRDRYYCDDCARPVRECLACPRLYL